MVSEASADDAGVANTAEPNSQIEIVAIREPCFILTELKIPIVVRSTTQVMFR